MQKTLVTLVIVGLSLSQVANAATSFDFTNLSAADDTASVDVLSADGFITATLTAPDGTLGATDLSGIGVRSSGSLARPLSNNEILRIDFSSAIDLGVIIMSQWEGVDQLSLTDSNAGTPIILTGDSCTTCSLESFAVNLANIDYLIIEGDSLATSAFLAGFSNVSVVPIPAAAWLFASALAGLGWFRRKQKI